MANAVLLLLSLLGLLATATPVCNESTYADFYFDLCLADTDCAYSLDLHADERSLFANILHNDLLVPSHLSYIDMCQDANVTGIWLGILTGFPFCQWNQVPDLSLGCVCREDRLCSPSHPSTFAVDELGLYVILLVALVIIAYASLSVTKDSREVRKELAATAARQKQR